MKQLKFRSMLNRVTKDGVTAGCGMSEQKSIIRKCATKNIGKSTMCLTCSLAVFNHSKMEQRKKYSIGSEKRLGLLLGAQGRTLEQAMEGARV